MKSLAQLQQAFKGYVIQQESDIFAEIERTERLNKQIRVDIYANAYRMRLIEALQTDFPILLAMLGDEAFFTMGLAYIAAHPSDNPSLRWFGRHMARFLAQQAPYAEQGMLAEMAAFEWALRTAFDAGDDTSATIHDAAVVPGEAWPDLQLSFCAAVHLLPISWNTPAVWRSVHDEQDEPVQPVALPQPMQCLFWRYELITRYRVLEELDEAQALSVMLKGGSFADMCAVITEYLDEEQAPMRAASLLKSWLTEGLVNRLIYPE